MTLTMQSHDLSIESAAKTMNELIHSFGFYPENSLIIRWCLRSEVVLTQRCDVEAFLEPSELSGLDLEIFIEPGRIYRADEALIVVCLDSMDSRVYAGIETVEKALNQVGIRIALAFVVVGQQILTSDCAGDCDPHFTLIDTEVNRSTRAAACESDSALLIKSKDFPKHPETHKLISWRAHESQFVHELLIQKCGPVSDIEFARLTVALGDIRVRDSILWDMANQVFDRTFVADLLTDLLPKLGAERGAPVATTAAICWWLLGNGAMANLCIERAVADTPHYSLATMIRAALDYALSPDFWLESVNILTREQCLAGLDVAP